MVGKRLLRTCLPILLSLLVITGLVFHTRLSGSQPPLSKSGILDLSKWDREKPIELAGEWEFYWGDLPSGNEIREGNRSPMLVNAPGYWNQYKRNGAALPGMGRATYRIRVTGADAYTRCGMRIQNMSTVYRLYIDNTLIAQNGNFGDTASAAISAYRPQLAEFTPEGSSFDIILQIENSVYGMGGMQEPIIFGSYAQIWALDKQLSNLGASAMAGLMVTCLFFLIFFAAQRGEREMLILSGVCMLVFMRFLMMGDVALASLFPGMTIALMLRIEFLTLPWTQFLLLYFVYCAYGNLVRRWLITALLIITVGMSLFILLSPVDTMTSAYQAINMMLLFVIALITMYLVRGAIAGHEGAPLLLGAICLVLLMILYELFVPDRSVSYYLLSNLHIEYMAFVLAQVAVVALRYRRAQALEIAHLKGQIRPHFIHNALTCIISISRTNPDRARELLVDFSSYLRGFYECDRDEMVSFAQELELVRAYVTLEQARFGDKLRIVYQIETADFLLPPLILQPLVENAFVHGLKEKDQGGTVTVYAIRLESGRVHVGVRDDGVGICAKPSKSRRGVGIENINRRLNRLYHTSLVYTKPEGHGCEVYFEIPFKETMKCEGMAG